MIGRFILLLGITALVSVWIPSAVARGDEPPATPKQVEIGKIKWYVDYDAALEVAKRQGKPLWLHFGENPG